MQAVDLLSFTSPWSGCWEMLGLCSMCHLERHDISSRQSRVLFPGHCLRCRGSHGYGFWDQEFDWLTLGGTHSGFTVGRQLLLFLTIVVSLERSSEHDKDSLTHVTVLEPPINFPIAHPLFWAMDHWPHPWRDLTKEWNVFMASGDVVFNWKYRNRARRWWWEGLNI